MYMYEGIIIITDLVNVDDKFVADAFQVIEGTWNTLTKGRL